MQVQHIFGLDFVTEATIDDVARALLDSTGRDAWSSVVTPNVDHLVRYERNPDERTVGQAASVVLPDGAPIVWASKLLGVPLSGRLTGSDLFSRLWPLLAAEERSVLAIVGSDLIADRLRAELASVATIVPPMFDVTDRDALVLLADEVVAHANRVPTDFVVIGVSMPKHHALAAELMSRPVPPTGAPMLLLLGASAEFHVGVQIRAPHWMRRAGLEWVHRLVKNPRGMAKRYLVDDVAFARTVWREYRGRRKVKR